MLSFLNFANLTDYSKLTSARVVGYEGNKEIQIDFLDFGIGLYNYINQLNEQVTVIETDYETLYFDTNQINALYLETGITNFSYVIEDNQLLTLLPISAGRVDVEYTDGLSANREFLNLGDYLFVESLSTNNMFTIYYNATGSDMFMTSPGEDTELDGKRPKFGGVQVDESDEDRRIRLERPRKRPRKKSVTPIVSNVVWNNPTCLYHDTPFDPETGKYTSYVNFSVTLPFSDPKTESSELHWVYVYIDNVLPFDVEFVDNTAPGKRYTTTKGPGDTFDCRAKIKCDTLNKGIVIRVVSYSGVKYITSETVINTNFIGYCPGHGGDFE